MACHSKFPLAAVFPLLLFAGCGGDGGGGAPADGAVRPSGHVNASCTDGRYHETATPNPSASLSGVTFSGDIAATVDAALAARYPFGLDQVRGGRMYPGFPGDCSVVFAGSPATPEDVERRLDVIVHECGHLQDLRMPSSSYVIQPSLTLMCPSGEATERGGMTFARSRINTDDYAALRPACAGSTRGCDFYRNVYLDGDPDNMTFEGGDQGMSLLLEEAVQYINSLAVAWAFNDVITSGTSAKDGVLTFLWYIERYLHHARTHYPAAYTFIIGNSCWRDLILTIWGRAWYYLDSTQSISSIGIDAAAIQALVEDATLLDEIQRVRVASGCH